MTGSRLYLLTYRAEPFLRSRQLCSHSRTSQNFIEPEGSIPCSQEPSTVPIMNHINPINIIPFYRPKIHFNIVHSPTSWSSQWSLFLWLSYQYLTFIPLLPHSCYMHRPFHPSWLDNSNYTWSRVQVVATVQKFQKTFRHNNFNSSLGRY
jgi:hypothetical protein